MTLTIHSAPVVLPICAEPLYDAAVVVDADRVLAVGPVADIVAAHPGAARERWQGMLTPGLVNAHAHLEYGPSFGDLASGGLAFPVWMAELVKRWEHRTEADWLADARGSVRALLATGTTCVADIVTIGPGRTAAAERGLSGISYLEVVACDDGRWPETGARLRGHLDSATPDRMVGVSPHTLYTVSLSVYRSCLELARGRGLRLHPHLAETRAEHEFVHSGAGDLARTWGASGLSLELLAQGGAGISPAQLLDELGGLGADVHVAHGVHLDAGDRALLRARGVTVTLCTRSNRILGAGEAPVADLLAEGSPLAVGTDSLSSAPSLDLLAELAALRELAVRQGTPAQPALDRRLLEAATIGGAQAMGLEDVGVLRTGARGDLASFAVTVAAGEDPYAALVARGAGSCEGTVLGGTVVHRGRVAG